MIVLAVLEHGTAGLGVSVERRTESSRQPPQQKEMTLLLHGSAKHVHPASESLTVTTSEHARRFTQGKREIHQRHACLGETGMVHVLTLSDKKLAD